MSCYNGNMKQSISYLRVSTTRQGVSGLGLEAQRSAVESFAKQHFYEVVEEFVEIESGRRNDRPRLAAALAYARDCGATLLISRLDRLARNVAFISGLMDSGADFRACDLPEANRLLLHVMAAVGEAEARAVSERTKAALQAARDRGTLLGAQNPLSRNLRTTQEDRIRGGQSTRQKARAWAANLAPKVRELRDSGLSLAQVAQKLNDSKKRTRTGKRWTPMQVARVLQYTEKVAS
jgi:DNA invertase Pin-like site-specific DNA recombinase